MEEDRRLAGHNEPLPVDGIQAYSYCRTIQVLWHFGIPAHSYCRTIRTMAYGHILIAHYTGTAIQGHILLIVHTILLKFIGLRV